MVKYNEKVMAMVEAELGKDPDASNADLFAKAKKISRSMAKLTKRQFHAQYPLQVKRRKGGSAGPKKRKAKVAAAKRATRRSNAPRAAAVPVAAVVTSAQSGRSSMNRDGVRQVLLNFASELTAAEDRKDLVNVLAGVDRYVDQVSQMAG